MTSVGTRIVLNHSNQQWVSVDISGSWDYCMLASSLFTLRFDICSLYQSLCTNVLRVTSYCLQSHCLRLASPAIVPRLVPSTMFYYNCPPFFLVFTWSIFASHYKLGTFLCATNIYYLNNKLLMKSYYRFLFYSIRHILCIKATCASLEFWCTINDEYCGRAICKSFTNAITL